MDLGLKGKIAVITGASRGIGKAIAIALAAEGVATVLASRNPKDLKETASEVGRYGPAPLTIAVDLMKKGGAGKLIRQGLKHYGKIDVLVNNLGGPLHFLPFLELTDDDWRAEIELDLMTAVRCCREVIPPMRKNGGGRIINIGSMSGVEMEEKFPDYRVAKAALIALGKYLSVEFAKDQISVNTVLPGAVWTPSWEVETEVMAKRKGVSAEKMARTLRTAASGEIPLGRMGTPEEIARLVVFLASPTLTWMTGSTIRIDGGAARLVL